MIAQRKTKNIFVEPKAKNNRQYYWDMLLLVTLNYGSCILQLHHVL